MPDVNDYGMKVSRQGYPVLTAADHQLLYSSSWKMPVVVQSGTYILGSGGHPNFDQDQTVATHSLGYHPVVLFFLKNASTALITTGGRYEATANPGVTITSSILKYYANSFPDNSTEIAYQIFNVDLEVDYTAPIINTSPATQAAATTDWGIKASKDTFDVKTAGLADLVSTSGSGGTPVRHQMIHAVGGTVGLTNGSTLTVAHGLGYAPMFLFFQKDGSDYWGDMSRYSTGLVGGLPAIIVRTRTYADATNIYYLNNTGGTVTLRFVIFKDPLLT